MAWIVRHGIWAVVTALGVGALGVLALSRGESINALWMVVAASPRWAATSSGVIPERNNVVLVATESAGGSFF